MASLERLPGDGIGDTFKQWVKKYLLNHLPAQENGQPLCCEIDIWGARCGIIHALSPDSNIGQAKKICYAWGTARAAELEGLLNKISEPDEPIAKLFRRG